jgi:basic amino acid/polyamine antiporter, APA family
MANIWVRKPLSVLLAEADEPEVQALTTHDGVPLKRTLSALNLVALGIGAIIGAGIFVLTGHAAAANAGPAITLSFVLGAFACAFAGLCYAEMASTVPIAGSAYTYAYATLGEFIAWIIGWDLILEYALGAVTVAIGWSGYVVSFLKNLGIVVPDEFATAPFSYDAGEHVWRATGAIINIPAMLVIVAVSTLLVVGIRESARVNNVIVAIKLVIILVFIAAAVPFVTTAHWVAAGNPDGAFIPPNAGPGQFGLSGVLRGAAVVFFAYIGFDAVSTAAQEAKNPKRDMPIGILGSLVICTILYVLFSYVLSGVATVEDFRTAGKEASVTFAISKYMIGYAWLGKFVTIAILAGFSSVILVMLMGQSRVFYSMSHDGLVPAIFSEVHPKYQTPYKANMLFFVFTALFGAFLPESIVGEMTSIGTLFAFILVCAGVWIMRVRRPELVRGFRVPALPLVAVLGIVVCGAMIYGLGWTNWLRLGAWLVIGLVFYFSYGIKHSRLELHKEEAGR